MSKPKVVLPLPREQLLFLASTPVEPVGISNRQMTNNQFPSRREMLQQAANGFGSVALAVLLSETSSASPNRSGTKSPLARKVPHIEPRAKSVIFLFMDGGVSHVDTFDPKPQLTRNHGQPFATRIEPTQFDQIGNTLASPWSFGKYGDSGIPVSQLFPHVAQCVDDICVIRSMVAQSSVHQNADYFLHSGFTIQGRPSMGAWTGYGLGNENQNLPGFVVLYGGRLPPGGFDCFTSGFLPASYRGTVFTPGDQPLANITPLEQHPDTQRKKLDLMRKLDQGALDRLGHVDALESAIENYEMAARMQLAVPELADIRAETPATRKLYALDAGDEHIRRYGLECLLARRMVERGVRFVEVLGTKVHGVNRWDAHKDLVNNHTTNARIVDQPIAGLLCDLKSRGLLESTLVVWAGEFGRTPFAEGDTVGRDHSPFGFSIWMAGGGIRGGTIYGATDEFGYHAIEDPVEIYDLHATMLYQLGIDHKQLTYRYGGRDMRLTDVHGRVIHEILA